MSIWCVEGEGRVLDKELKLNPKYFSVFYTSTLLPHDFPSIHVFFGWVVEGTYTILLALQGFYEAQ